jgi:signal transduction histidine kinase/CheY-like chemotaxis protein
VVQADGRRGRGGRLVRRVPLAGACAGCQAAAAEALRQSEERYALAVAGSNEGIFDWDLKSDRVYLAQRTQQLLGLQAGEPWGRRKAWQEHLSFHPDDVDLQRQSIMAHPAGDTLSYDVESRLILPTGTRWFRQRGVALRDEEAGKPYRMVGSIGDITERRQEHEEMLRLESRLRQAQRFEALGALAGGIAHDFNNILGAILGYGERAVRDADPGSRLRRSLDSVIAAGERGRALVQSILAFSRGRAGDGKLVQVGKVVREAVELLQARLPPGVTLRADLRAERAAMVGDATQVHQIVMNLGINALQATPPAGGSLSISLEPVSVDTPRPAAVGTVTAGEWLLLTVGDTGSGMPPEVVERIFDPFFTTKEEGVGTGLGLSVVQRIVIQMAGAIEVHSRPGQGSTFAVYLPRCPEVLDGLAGPSAQEEPDLPPGHGQRVRVVDDDEPLLTLMTETLEELGYEAVGRGSSAAALEALRAAPERFDALITDENMPGMSGLELNRAVRDLRPSIPILLVSGSMITVQQPHEGVDVVLRKPLSMADLAIRLSEAFEAHAGS